MELFTVIMSLVVATAGFVLVKWLVSRGDSSGNRAPKVTLPPVEALGKEPMRARKQADERPRPSSAVPFLSVPSPESSESGNSEGGLKPRKLSIRGSNTRQMAQLRSLSQNRLPRELAFQRVALSEAELAGIEKLKEWLERDGIERCKIPDHHAADDSFIGRFVRGKKCDVDKAYEQLKLCLAWRSDNRIDTISEWYRKEYATSAEGIDHYFPWQSHGVDSNGVNVVWDRLPSMDFKTLMTAFSKDELIYWHCETMEKNSQRLYRAGQFGGVFVEDFTGLSMAHWYKPAVEFLKLMMHTDQQNYPEFSAGIFYINAPRVLSGRC